jgi:hypothetical protein
MYRGGAKPAKGTIADRVGGMDDVNELVLLDGEDQPIQVSRYWLTVLGENDKVPGLSVADLLYLLEENQVGKIPGEGVPIEIDWPSGMGSGETRLVLTADVDRMQGEGSKVLRLHVGQQYDKE